MEGLTLPDESPTLYSTDLYRMITTTVTVCNSSGLDSRPAATIVRKASAFRSNFAIIRDGFRVNGKSIIGVMTLAAEPGLQLTLEFDGPDEEDAAKEIVGYFERGFDGD